MKYAVIGDVHGELEKLMHVLAIAKTLERTPIFVGDLQDRGPQSKEVIEYIKSNNYLCVLGNHDKIMIEMHEAISELYENTNTYHNWGLLQQWCQGGGFEVTMVSYKLGGSIDLAYGGKKLMLNPKEDSDFEIFTEHVNWLKTLPLYLELDLKINDRPVVISHSDISSVWHKIKGGCGLTDREKEMIIWSRTTPTDRGIFNIFGHTPLGLTPTITDFYANIDTGCGKGGVLSGLLLPELTLI